MAQVIKAQLSGRGRRVGVAVSRFNELVSGRLLEGALDALQRHGVADDDVTVVWVPGAFELPLACRWLIDAGKRDAVVALGAVIRGATSHYEYVCAQAARGVLESGMASGVPVAFGVLTCETLEQALERAGSKAGNKGAEAALTALEMAGVRDRLQSG